MPGLSLTAVPIDKAAALLSNVARGPAIPADRLAADVAAGCPVNPDGTLNLIHYLAWLIKEA